MAPWILADDLEVRPADGGWQAWSRSSAGMVVSGGRALPELLAAFRTAAEPAEVLARRGAVAGETRLVRELAGAGVLLPAEQSPAAPAADPEAFELKRRLAERQRSQPGLHLDDDGLTVTSCGREHLSPGCQACKDGTWLCVFVGLGCNARCPFCPQSAEARQLDEPSLGGGWVERLLAGLEDHAARVRAVSISGGEPLLYEPVAHRILAFLDRRFPEIYTWLDTNGILATADRLERLRDLGLDEIRFNLGATGFAPALLRRMRREAVGRIPWVAVEVPMCEATHEHLVRRGKLIELDDMGVQQLNLGQLFSGAPGSPVRRHFGDLFRCDGSPSSRALRFRHWTYDVLELAERRGLRLRVNDCSDEAKLAQAQARERVGGAELIELAHLAHPSPDPPCDRTPPPLGPGDPVPQRLLAGGRRGRRPAETDGVALRYSAWTLDGALFGSSYRSGLEGVWFRLSDLPPGLSASVLQMDPGERRRVWLPGDPPLVVDVELTAVRPAQLPC